jgi:hypothetical protein
MSSPSDPPPTLDISLPGLRASATYFVRVEIARAGLLWPELKRETEVGFRPYDSVYSLTPLLSTRTSATAMLAAECLDPQKRIRYESPWLPKHSPSLPVIPCPAALTPGKPLDIALVVFPSDCLLEQLAIIRLRSLHIGLRASTTVQVGTLSSTVSSHVRILFHGGRARYLIHG